MNKQKLACGNCGKERIVSGWQTKQSTYTGLCANCSKRRLRTKPNSNWTGGRTRNAQGYIEIRLFPNNPFYPMAAKKWHYCKEHRYIMAEHLGRCLLPEETVHHINGIKDDNRIENLRLESPADHLSKTKFCRNCPLRREIRLLHEKIVSLETHIKSLNIKEWGIE